MRAVRVAVLLALLVALAAAPAVAHAGKPPKPSANELWRTYPLNPSPTAVASAARATVTATARPRAARAPAPHRSGGQSWLPLVLAAVGLATVAVTFASRWFSRARAERPAAEPAPPVAASRTSGPLWRRPAQAARPVAPSPAPEWPWPDDLDGRWRCEIGLAAAALSAQVQAVAHDPGGEARTVLAASPAGPGGPDWQSSAALDEAIDALAAELAAHGWEPVAGGRPHTRRLYWPHEGDPFARAEEAAWTA